MKVTNTIFTLPAMCLIVCTMVATGITGISGTDSVPAVDQTPPQHQPAPLPKGYVAYPDIGFAYKFHRKYVTFQGAKNGCIAEGAQLALIDSIKKMEYVKRQIPRVYQFYNYTYVGIVRDSHDRNTWVSVSTGLPVASLPWSPNNPVGSGDCVKVDFSVMRLLNLHCEDYVPYVCEIPIRVQNNTSPGN